MISVEDVEQLPYRNTDGRACKGFVTLPRFLSVLCGRSQRSQRYEVLRRGAQRTLQILPGESNRAPD